MDICHTTKLDNIPDTMTTVQSLVDDFIKENNFNPEEIGFALLFRPGKWMAVFQDDRDGRDYYVENAEYEAYGETPEEATLNLINKFNICRDNKRQTEK